MDPAVSALFDDLRTRRFRDLAGAQITVHVPISRVLLNRIVADALRKTTVPVRHVDVRPLGADRFQIVVSLKWTLVPPVTVTFAIERQPVFPDAPLLVLRWSLPAGLGAIASQFVGAIKSLPDGVHLEEDRVVLDLQRLAAGTAAGEALPYVNSLQVHTTEDAAVVDADLRPLA